jgi:hypothetical protein
MKTSQMPFEGQSAECLDEHHVRRPICGEPVDRRDLEEAARHLEPGHAHPKPAFGTNGMTRKMEAETSKRVAKSIDTLERTKPKEGQVGCEKAVSRN